MKDEIKYPLVIGISYLIFGVTWIFASDSLVELIARSPEQYKNIQSIKGVLYVVLSACFISWLASHFYKRHSRNKDKLIELYWEDKRMFEEFPLGLAVIGMDDRFIKCNKAFAEMLGYTLQEMKGISRYEITLKDDYQDDDLLKEKLLSGKEEAYHLKKKLVTSKGAEIWCSITVMLMRNFAGTPKYFVASFENINNETLLNEELKQLNKDLIEAQRIGNFGHWMLHLERNEFSCSDVVKSILGMENVSEKRIPAKFLSMLEKPVSYSFKRQLCRSIRHHEKLNTIARIQLSNGQIKYLNIEATVNFKTSAESHCVRGTVKDVTENVILYEERAQFTNNVIKWSNMLSHELRRPLGSLLGLLNIVDVKHVSEGDKTKLVNYIKTASMELDLYTKRFAKDLYEMELQINHKNTVLSASYTHDLKNDNDL